MNEFEIKSKIYCPPRRKDHIVFIIVNIAVIITVILSFISIALKGFTIGNVCPCIVAISVFMVSKIINNTKGHYEFCVLSIILDNNFIKVSYQPLFDKTIEINIDSILSLEYSDKLSCLRLTCNYKENNNSIETVRQSSELLLYINFEENALFYHYLTEKIKQNIIFVDRRV